LVRRVENMIADTANYRDDLTRRHDHALPRIGELEAVAEQPFEHTEELRDKRQRLDTLTAQLQIAADSPQAQAKKAEHQQRLDAAGRQPGWSLALNPTPALLVEHGPEALARLAGRGAAAPAEPLSDAESRVAAVMAGRRTKTIQQIVAHAAYRHGGNDKPSRFLSAGVWGRQPPRSSHQGKNDPREHRTSSSPCCVCK